MKRLLFAALLALAAPAVAQTTYGDTTVCFVPGNDCAALVVAQIAKAEKTLLVQAYNFTEPRIGAAIVAAHARGVDVTVILDKISPSQKSEQADPVYAAGIPTYIDRKPKIAHNKVMVGDERWLITGSFNFSTNANTANAENLLVIERPDIAAAYAANFRSRLNVSVAYKPPNG